MSHVQHHLYFHVIWATKLCAPTIIATVRPQVWAAIGRGVVAANGRLEAIGGVAARGHLLLRLPPTVTLTHVIKRAKGSSSHLIGQIHPELEFAWQEGYAAFSLEPAARPTLAEYIANQQAHHASSSSRHEWEIAGDNGTLGASPPQADFVVAAQELIPGISPSDTRRFLMEGGLLCICAKPRAAKVGGQGWRGGAKTAQRPAHRHSRSPPSA